MTSISRSSTMLGEALAARSSTPPGCRSSSQATSSATRCARSTPAAAPATWSWRDRRRTTAPVLVRACEEITSFGSERITIDLGRSRHGRCSNSFYDRHAMPGYAEAVACSFAEFLARMLATEPDAEGDVVPFSLGDDFEPRGDAFED